MSLGDDEGDGGGDGLLGESYTYDELYAMLMAGGGGDTMECNRDRRRVASIHDAIPHDAGFARSLAAAERQ